MSLFFVPRVVGVLSRGMFFRKAIALFLQVLGILFGIGGAVTVVLILLGMEATVRIAEGVTQMGVVVGGIFTVVLEIISTYMFVHLFFFRASTVSSLEGEEFILISIAVVLTRLGGELFALSFAIWATFGFVVSWMMGEVAGSFVRALPVWSGYPSLLPLLEVRGIGFLWGILMLIGGALMAVFSLFGAYFLAEIMGLLPRIAQNTTRIADATRK